VVKIARGAAPSFLRTLDIAYPQEGPRVTIEPREPWIAGDTRAVRVRVENPGPAALEGNLELLAGSFYRAENPPLHVSIPAKSHREFSFPMEIPRPTSPSILAPRCVSRIPPARGRRIRR
jgi:hypothetical protein